MTADNTQESRPDRCNAASIEPPIKAKQTLQPASGAHIRAESFNVDGPLKVMGTLKPDSFIPVVGLSLETGSFRGNYLGLTFTPDEARDLAGKLESQADYAERYSENKKQEWETEGGTA